MIQTNNIFSGLNKYIPKNLPPFSIYFSIDNARITTYNEKGEIYAQTTISVPGSGDMLISNYGGSDENTVRNSDLLQGFSAAALNQSAHAASSSNPHGVTKAQVGLGNVDNTSDLNKPLSTATISALASKIDLSANNTFTGTNAFQAPYTTFGSPAIPTAGLSFVLDSATGQNNIALSQNTMELIFRSNTYLTADHLNTQLKTTLDPTTGDGIGNRDYNDLRYAFVADVDQIPINTASIAANTSSIQTNVSGIIALVNDVSALEGDQITQNNAIALNTAKVSYTDAAQVSQNGIDIAVNAGNILTLQGEQAAQNNAISLNTDKRSYPIADENKLSGIEALADVTNTTNVTNAGALMDSEVANLAQVKNFSATDYATAAQGVKADSAAQLTATQTFTGINTFQSATGPFIYHSTGNNAGNGGKLNFGMGDNWTATIAGTTTDLRFTVGSTSAEYKFPEGAISDPTDVITKGYADATYLGDGDNIALPHTDAGGTVGVYSNPDGRFIHNYTSNAPQPWYRNIFMGHMSGNFSIAGTGPQGIYNVGVGNYTLNALTTGAFNTAIGTSSLEVLTTGSGNTGIGEETLYALQTGSDNMAMGKNSMDNITTGSHNVSIGRNTGIWIADGSTPLTSANQSIYIGGLSKALVDAPTNEIVLGYSAIGKGSNTAVIGNASITSISAGADYTAVNPEDLVTKGYADATYGVQDLSNYVTLDGVQTITGNKTMIAQLDVTGRVYLQGVTDLGGLSSSNFIRINGREISAFNGASLSNLDFVAGSTFFNSDFFLAGGKTIMTAGGVTNDLEFSTSDVTKGIHTDRYIHADGEVTGSNLSGTNTGDQDISGIATNSSNILDRLKSVTAGEPAGSNIIINKVSISQADYDAAFIAGTLVATTEYSII